MCVYQINVLIRDCSILRKEANIMADTKKKPGRTIFQPTQLVSSLIKGFQNNRPDCTISDFLNTSIIRSIKPYNSNLHIEAQRIMKKMSNCENVTTEELKLSLENAVKALMDCPINTCKTLEKIFMHFRTSIGRAYRYDYINIVDDEQDAQLHRLNEILTTLDNNYNMGQREFGERTRDIFNHWDELHGYPEIYQMLATIINCEDVYIPLDAFMVLDFLMCLDYDISQNSSKKQEEPFKVNITTKQRIKALQYEINVYQCENGYADLTNDHSFENMPVEFISYERELLESELKFKEMNEDTLNAVRAIETKGRNLLKQLSIKGKI